MDKKIKVLDRVELNEVIDLFEIVWNQKREALEQKTKWAFADSTRSKVLVVNSKKNKIIAVRGGMQWPLSYNGEIVRAYQLHGTCVHPDYRRQGIFSAINRKYVRELTADRNQLIFNVSVDASRLGYEKLGWKYIKGFRRLTNFNKPVNILKNKYFKNIQEASLKNKSKQNENILVSEKLLIKREFLFRDLLHTKYDKEFLKWRLSNKKENYKSYNTDDGTTIYKIKYRKNLKELIIGEVFLFNNKFIPFRKIIKELIQIEKPDVTYTYIFNTHPYYNYYLRLFFIPNPINYNLNFGTKILGSSNKGLLANKKWGLSFLDIDTF